MSSKEQSKAEPGDIQAGGVIPRAIPQALGVFTAQPGSPVQGLATVGQGWGGKSASRLVAVRAGVGGATRLHLPGADPQEQTLVAEHAPELPAHGRVIPPVAPASPHAPTTPF